MSHVGMFVIAYHMFGRLYKFVLNIAFYGDTEIVYECVKHRDNLMYTLHEAE